MTGGLTRDPRPACEHENTERTPVYRDGLPVYRCRDCGSIGVDENVEPQTKLIPLAAAAGSPE